MSDKENIGLEVSTKVRQKPGSVNKVGRSVLS